MLHTNIFTYIYTFVVYTPCEGIRLKFYITCMLWYYSFTQGMQDVNKIYIYMYNTKFVGDTHSLNDNNNNNNKQFLVALLASNIPVYW
jgi:hypothetical protein